MATEFGSGGHYVYLMGLQAAGGQFVLRGPRPCFKLCLYYQNIHNNLGSYLGDYCHFSTCGS